MRPEPGGTVTNNNTELHAIVRGLQAMPHGWTGEVWTDSWVTITRIQRLARDKAEQINGETEARLLEAARALRRCGPIKLVHVKGHATVEDLKAGTYSGDRGKRNPRRTSKFNAWCDEECGRVIKELKSDIEESETPGVGPAAGDDAGADRDVREVQTTPGDGQGPPAQEGPDRLEDRGGPAGVPDGGEALSSLSHGPGRVEGVGPAQADVLDRDSDCGVQAGECLPVGVQAADAPAAVVGPGVDVQRAKARKVAARVVKEVDQIVYGEKCPYCHRVVPSVALHIMACEAVDFGGGEEEGENGSQKVL
jgi:hypothetical protein